MESRMLVTRGWGWEKFEDVGQKVQTSREMSMYTYSDYSAIWYYLLESCQDSRSQHQKEMVIM